MIILKKKTHKTGLKKESIMIFPFHSQRKKYRETAITTAEHTRKKPEKFLRF